MHFRFSASIASGIFDMPIHVIDTLLTENGLGMLVKNLSKMIANGSDTDALSSNATIFIRNPHNLFLG